MDTSVLTAAFERAGLDGLFITRNHPKYHQSRQVWNGVIDRRPSVIVRAGSSADVIKVVNVAAEQGALLAVRCGAHSFPGLSTCDDGIVLDLSSMKDISIDPLSRIAEVSGGALLGDLDAAGAPHNLVTPAGVVSHTGVGGLTLGGGMGWLSRRFGLTIDNLLSVDIVTADGRLLRANPSEEPDLFWAIRGGGGNFGVVTKFRFQMHVLGPVVVGRWTYPPSVMMAALSSYRERIVRSPRELTTVCVMTPAGLGVTALWSGPPAKSESILSPLGALGGASSSAIGGVSFLELQKASDERMAWGRRYYAKGGFVREIDEQVSAVLAEAMALAPNVECEVYMLQLGGAVCDTEENATPYTGRDAGHYWIVEPAWDKSEDDERCIAWGRNTAAKLSAISMRGNYVNEQSEMGVAASAYGHEKYARLAKLKGRYDPTNLFRLNQNIEPRT